MELTPKQQEYLLRFFEKEISAKSFADLLRGVCYNIALARFRHEEEQLFNENDFFWLSELSNILAGEEWHSGRQYEPFG